MISRRMMHESHWARDKDEEGRLGGKRRHCQCWRCVMCAGSVGKRGDGKEVER